MRQDAPVIILAEWAARTNADTRAAMGVVIGPELPEYSPPPDQHLHRALREAGAYLDGLMTDDEAAACVAADLARACPEVEEVEDEYAGLSATFAAACRVADERQRSKPVDPAIERARRLLADNVTLDQAWAEVSKPPSGRAANSAVDALVFLLREGVAALERPETIQRLSQIDDQQLRAVMVRLQKFESAVAKAWTPDDVAVLAAVRGKIHD